MRGWVVTCWDACRVAVVQGGMNLSVSVAVFVLELAARAVRARPTPTHDR
ncbi:MAG TPA: hypothetical protein VFB07_11840 [Vicinamibacterales bacterium]|nr:hypothetical protein [Vicinamibacterales bacterium]